MSDNKISNIKKPTTNYCSNCVYPDSFARVLSFDDNRVCSGCTVSQEKMKLDYKAREKQLIEIIEKNKVNKHYDCIIPVSGGKDSFFQAHTIKRLGFNALLVTYNGNNYTKTGLRNVQRMREVFGLITFFSPLL